MAGRNGEVTVVEQAYGYKIYYKDGIYFLDLHKTKTDGYESLASAREAAYYAGLRPTKE